MAEEQGHHNKTTSLSSFEGAFKTATKPFAKAAKKIDKIASGAANDVARALGTGSKPPSNSSSFHSTSEVIAEDMAGHATSPGRGAKEEELNSERTAPAVLPDETLPKMDVFIDKEILKGVSVIDYYDVVWSESDNVNPFYPPWLTAAGKMNVSVGGWEESEEEDCVGEWDEETYQKKRVVTFTTKRSGLGPPTADVTQTQLCRVEGDDKCVVAIKIDMKVPFGDCFSVHVRWVASRLGSRDLSISAGMLINFKKSCLVEGKIRSNTTAETKKGQTSLFQSMKKACVSVAVIDAAAEDTADQEELEEKLKKKGETMEKEEGVPLLVMSKKPCWGLVPDFILKLFGRNANIIEIVPSHSGEHDDIVRAICSAHHQLGKIHDTLCTQQPSTFSKKERTVRSELEKVNATLASLNRQLKET